MLLPKLLSLLFLSDRRARKAASGLAVPVAVEVDDPSLLKVGELLGMRLDSPKPKAEADAALMLSRSGEFWLRFVGVLRRAAACCDGEGCCCCEEGASEALAELFLDGGNANDGLRCVAEDDAPAAGAGVDPTSGWKFAKTKASTRLTTSKR